MTRIAVISGNYLPERCSIADYTVHLCTALSEYNIESVILTTYYAAEAAYDPRALSVVHGWRLADLRSLVQAVHIANADILHIHYAAASYGFDNTILLLPLMLRVTGWRSPIVTTVHEYSWQESQPQGWFSRLLKSSLLTFSDAAIATNAKVQTEIQLQLPQLQSRIFSIPELATASCAHSQQSEWQSLAKLHLDIYYHLATKFATR